MMSDGLASGTQVAKAGALRKGLVEISKELVRARLSESELGPVAGAAMDTESGRMFFFRNEEGAPGKVHPLLEGRIRALEATPQHPSTPGAHAEVYALNEALLARESATMKSLTEADLNSF